MSIIKVFFILFYMCIAFVSFSQSKKEQITALQLRIDSLMQISIAEEGRYRNDIQLLNHKIDSISYVLKQNLDEIMNKHLLLLQCQKERSNQLELFETQHRRIDLLEKNYASVQKNLDSLEIVNAKCSRLNMIHSSFEQDMVFVEGGFMKGSIGGRVMNTVRSNYVGSFRIGKLEISQVQWLAIMGSNPSHFSGCDDCPVENVSWNEVQQFIFKLNSQTGKSYRLPTETEWEFAAIGGRQSRSFSYIGSNELNSVAWYDLNSGGKTHPVGAKESNELGIYDMAGNVWEWCSDWNSDEFNMGQSFCNDNQTKTHDYPDNYRILAGGGWNEGSFSCAKASRAKYNPDRRDMSIGFRLVLPVE